MNKQLKLKIIELYDTQEGFAKALACQPSIVSEVIRGKRNLSLAERRRWALMLGDIAVDRLFGDMQ